MEVSALQHPLGDQKAIARLALERLVVLRAKERQEYWLLAMPGQKVVVIGDAAGAGKAREAIASAYRAAYGR